MDYAKLKIYILTEVRHGSGQDTGTTEVSVRIFLTEEGAVAALHGRFAELSSRTGFYEGDESEDSRTAYTIDDDGELVELEIHEAATED